MSVRISRNDTFRQFGKHLFAAFVGELKVARFWQFGLAEFRIEAQGHLRCAIRIAPHRRGHIGTYEELRHFGEEATAGIQCMVEMHGGFLATWHFIQNIFTQINDQVAGHAADDFIEHTSAPCEPSAEPVVAIHAVSAGAQLKAFALVERHVGQLQIRTIEPIGADEVGVFSVEAVGDRRGCIHAAAEGRHESVRRVLRQPFIAHQWVLQHQVDVPLEAWVHGVFHLTSYYGQAVGIPRHEQRIGFDEVVGIGQSECSQPKHPNGAVGSDAVRSGTNVEGVIRRCVYHKRFHVERVIRASGGCQHFTDRLQGQVANATNFHCRQIGDEHGFASTAARQIAFTIVVRQGINAQRWIGEGGLWIKRTGSKIRAPNAGGELTRSEVGNQGVRVVVAGFHNGAPHTGEVFTRTVVVDGTGVVVAGILVGAPDARLVIARPVIFGRRRVEVARPDICAPELIRLSGEVIRPSQCSQEYEQ